MDPLENALPCRKEDGYSETLRILFLHFRERVARLKKRADYSDPAQLNILHLYPLESILLFCKEGAGYSEPAQLDISPLHPLESVFW